MPRCPTPAQSEAARRNGARSRGPRTEEGKRRSAGNGRTRGLRAGRFGLLPGEDAARFAMLAGSVRDHYRPADALEALLCRQMAEALWLTERAERLEALVVAALDGWPVAAGRRLPGLATVLRYLGRAERAYARTGRQLAALQGRAAPTSSATPICTSEPETATPGCDPAARAARPADRAPRFRTSEPEPPALAPAAPPPPATGDSARTNPTGGHAAPPVPAPRPPAMEVATRRSGRAFPRRPLGGGERKPGPCSTRGRTGVPARHASPRSRIADRPCPGGWRRGALRSISSGTLDQDGQRW
jgi:hypothetical protein